MMDLGRLTAKLRVHGLEHGWTNSVSQESVFRLFNERGQTFSRIMVDWGGDTVAASTWISLTHGPPQAKGLLSRRFIWEVADEKQKPIHLGTKVEAEAWEDRLAEIARSLLDKHSSDVSLQLQAENAEELWSATQYARILAPAASPHELAAAIEGRATDAHLSEFRRLTASGQFTPIPDAKRLFELAALCVCVHGADVEGRERPFATNTVGDLPVRKRINLLVDLWTRPWREPRPIWIFGPDMRPEATMAEHQR